MKIVGVAACVPKKVVETRSAAENFPAHDVNRIVDNTGVERKRETAPGTAVSTMCIAAGKDLLEAIGWEPETVDAVILVTAIGDVMMPATSYRIQHELGISNKALVFDINLGCSGFTHGLIVLHGLLKAGTIKRALLMTGDVSAGVFRPALSKCEHRSDLANAILFGEGGAATAVTSEGEDQVAAHQFGADGKGFSTILVKGGGGATPWNEDMFKRRVDEDGTERRLVDLILKGPEVLTFTMKRVPRLLKDLVERSGWSADDLDAFVPHQANKFMLDFLARRMKLPNEKMLTSIENFGNTAACSIPLTMVTEGGEHLTRPTKWAFMGFGVGLSWSGLFVETDKLIVPPLREI